MAKKWTFHRPAAHSPQRTSKPQQATAPRQLPKEYKTSSGRWTFHLPQQTNEPEGAGWHLDGPERDGDRWTCDYGCKSFVWSHEPEPGEYHAFDCPYWHNEGKDKTPF